VAVATAADIAAVIRELEWHDPKRQRGSSGAESKPSGDNR
jgi:hypothetical protein